MVSDANGIGARREWRPRDIPLTPDDHARFRLAFAGPVGGVVLTSWNAGQLLHVGSDGSLARTMVPPAAASFAMADGAIWFADFDHGRIGRIARDGRIEQHGVPTRFSGPTLLTVSERDVWFAELAAKKIGLYNGSRFTEYAAPVGRIALAAPGISGDAWFVSLAGPRAEGPTDVTLVHVTVSEPPATIIVHCSRIPDAMGVARDGTVWLGEDSAPIIAWRPGSGVMTEYLIADSAPSGWVRQIVRGEGATLYVFQNDHRVRTLPGG